MKKKGMIAAAAVAAAGIATYFISKKRRSHRSHDETLSPHDSERHLTGVFAKAKSTSAGK